MIKLIHDWRAKRKQAKQVAECRKNGHFLIRKGEGREGLLKDGVPIQTKPVTLWIMACKCGYGELDEVGTRPHWVTFAEGEEKLRKAKNGE